MKARCSLAAIAFFCVSAFAVAQTSPGTGPRAPGGAGAGAGAMQGQGRGPAMKPGPGQGTFMAGSPLYSAVESLNLSDDQRAKLAVIRSDEQRNVQAGTGAMRELRYRSGEAKAGTFDEAEERKRFEAEAAARKAIFEARLESRSRIEAMLTQEQREQLQQKLSRVPPPRR